MTHSLSRVGTPNVVGKHKRVIYDLTISSYTASGEALTPGELGFKNRIIRLDGGISSNGYVWRWDNAKIRAYRTGAAGGIITESFPNVLGGIFADDTSDGASATLNDAVVMSLADANATTSGALAHAAGKSTGLTNPNTLDGGAYGGRNVVMSQKADAGGTTFTAADIVVTGTDAQGNAITDTIALQTGAVAASNWRTSVGTKAFATVTNVRLTAAQPAGSQISIGIGTIFGLRGVITAESDIQSVRKDAADVAAATYVAIASPSQIDMGADIADDVDIIIQYDAQASSLIDREAASAANVGTVRIEAAGV